MRNVVRSSWHGSLKNNWRHEGAPEFLKSQGELSAFGVLCEIYRLMTGNGEWTGYPYMPQVFLGEIRGLPDAVREWADLTSEEVKFLSGKSFKEVKEWLTSPPLFMQQRKQMDLSRLPMLTYH